MRSVLLLTLAVMTGCSGPVPLHRAIWPRHERELGQMRGCLAATPREAWYALQAERETRSVEQVRQDDEALATTRNPFDARSDAEAVSRGAVIFREYCARCHGTDARGGGPHLLATHPAKDFHAFGKRFAVTLHGGAPRSWFRKISEGCGDEVQYPDGLNRAMPAFGDQLAREQIWLAVTYLQSLDVYVKPPPLGHEDAE
jgi:mono/diheme cytochrome c family protein